MAWILSLVAAACGDVDVESTTTEPDPPAATVDDAPPTEVAEPGPEAIEPEVTEPETTEPAGEPEAVEPETVEEVVEPEPAEEPEAVEPETVEEAVEADPEVDPVKELCTRQAGRVASEELGVLWFATGGKRYIPAVSDLFADSVPYAPAELVDDLQLLSDTYGTLAELLEANGWNLEALSGEGQALLDDSRVTAALDRIDAWAATNCSAELGPTGAYAALIANGPLVVALYETLVETGELPAASVTCVEEGLAAEAAGDLLDGLARCGVDLSVLFN